MTDRQKVHYPHPENVKGNGNPAPLCGTKYGYVPDVEGMHRNSVTCGHCIKRLDNPPAEKPLTKRDVVASVAVWAHDMLEINGCTDIRPAGYASVEFVYDGRLLQLEVKGVRK